MVTGSFVPALVNTALRGWDILPSITRTSIGPYLVGTAYMTPGSGLLRQLAWQIPPAQNPVACGFDSPEPPSRSRPPQSLARQVCLCTPHDDFPYYNAVVLGAPHCVRSMRYAASRP